MVTGVHSLRIIFVRPVEYYIAFRFGFRSNSFFLASVGWKGDLFPSHRPSICIGKQQEHSQDIEVGQALVTADGATGF